MLSTADARGASLSTFQLTAFPILLHPSDALPQNARWSPLSRTIRSTSCMTGLNI